MSRDAATLLDIARSAQLIIDFKQGMDKTAFANDLKTQSAIAHQLMVIGEAVKRLSPELRDFNTIIRRLQVPGGMVMNEDDLCTNQTRNSPFF